MLIGPTFTLNELEKHLESRLMGNRDRENKAINQFKELQKKLNVVPRLIDDEETGESIANPEYLNLYNESQKVQEELDEIIKQNDFIKTKLEELETIEDRSRGAIDKDKEKITLTLKDCIDLGIEMAGEE